MRRPTIDFTECSIQATRKTSKSSLLGRKARAETEVTATG